MVSVGLPAAPFHPATTVGWPPSNSWRRTSMPIFRNRSASHSAFRRQSASWRESVPALGIASSSMKAASAWARPARASSIAFSDMRELVHVAEHELDSLLEVLEVHVLVGAVGPGARLVEAGDHHRGAERALEVERDRDRAAGPQVVDRLAPDRLEGGSGSPRAGVVGAADHRRGRLADLPDADAGSRRGQGLAEGGEPLEALGRL